MSVASIFVGSFVVLQPLKPKRLKTILAYSSVNQVGYAFLTFNSNFSVIALESMMFYIFVYILSCLSSWCVLISLE